VQDQLKVHLNRLFQLPLDAIPLDRDLIVQVRNVLSEYPLHQLLYAGLKSRILRDGSHDLYLKKVLGPAGLSIMTTRNGQSPSELRIPAWYTVQGYQAVFKDQGSALVQEALKRNWVMGRRSNNQSKNRVELYKKLEKAYFKDYEIHWRRLLNNLKIKSAVNTDQAIHITDSLAGPDSPLKPLLLTLYKHTVFVGRFDSDLQAGGSNWYGPANAQAAHMSRTLPLPALALSRHFEDLTRLVKPGLNQPPPLDDVLSQLGRLRDIMLGSSPNDVNEIIRQSKREFSRLPEPIAGWLLPLTEIGS
jgi:type VI secretion system protein ImpL